MPLPSTLPGFVSAGNPPRFAGLPLGPLDMQAYNYCVDFMRNNRNVLRGPSNVQAAHQPWMGNINFFGQDQAVAKLTQLGNVARAGYAERQKFLPADANFMADKYSHDNILQYFPNLGQTDEWGRDFAGPGLDLGSMALQVAAYVAPYIPGVGPEIAVVIALAQGKELKDAILAGIKAELPGGPMVGFAFDVGVSMANGQDVKTSVLEATSNLSPEAAVGVLVGEIAAGGDVDPYVIAKAKKDFPEFAPLIDKATQHGAQVKAASPAYQSFALQKAANASLVSQVKSLPVGTLGVLILSTSVPGHRARVAPAARSNIKAVIYPVGFLALAFGATKLVAVLL